MANVTIENLLNKIADALITNINVYSDNPNQTLKESQKVVKDGVIKSLRETNFDVNIISIDCNELSAGFHMSDKYFVVPKVESRYYLKEVLKIVEKEKIDLILPTTERDIVKISKIIRT